MNRNRIVILMGMLLLIFFLVVCGFGSAATEEPPTATPVPPTATPLPPTPTPEPPSPTPDPPTSTPQPPTPEAPTPEPAEASAESLPFEPVPYVHPSGAFSFRIPQGWEVNFEDETSGFVVGEDVKSGVGAVFVDAGAIYDESDQQLFINAFLEGFLSELSSGYEVLEQVPQPDDSIYVSTAYTTDTGQEIGDFFFEQRGTVVFVFYFLSANYEQMLPTWTEIIGSYGVDPEAVTGSGDATAATDVIEFVVINNSNVDVCFLRLSPVDQEEWGPDQLDDDQVIAAAEQFTLNNIPVGTYDVQFQPCDESIDPLEDYGLDLTTNFEYTLKPAGSQ